MLKQTVASITIAGSLFGTTSSWAGGFNQNPIAVDDTASVICGSIVGLDVLANDYDLDGDSLSVVSASSGWGNAAAMGSYVEFEAQQPGTATVYYTIEDGNGGTASAVVTVQVRRSVVCSLD